MFFISEITVKCTLRCCPAGVSSLCLGTLFLVFLLISVSIILYKVFQAPVAWVLPRTWLEMWIIRTQLSSAKSESAFQKDPRWYIYIVKFKSDCTRQILLCSRIIWGARKSLMPKPHFVFTKTNSDEWVEPGHHNCFLKITWTSLAVQWLRICLAVQGAQVPSLVRDLDPTCCN